MVPILESRTDWYCPNCQVKDTTVVPQPHTRFHTCMGLRGLTAPLLRVGTKAKVEAHDREDYVANEIVQTDDTGRPVMSVTTTRDDGEDVIVFAPTSTMRA